MRSSLNGWFNKEKLSFLSGSAVVAAALYLFLTSGPIVLTPTASVAYGQSIPGPLHTPSLSERQAEDYYVVDGKMSKLIDPRTGLAVNRDRLSPFEPFKSPTVAAEKKVTTPEIPQAFQHELPRENEAIKRNFGAVIKEAHVTFMGAMTTSEGETYGLLKPTDGSSIMRVRKNSTIEAGGDTYTVKAIEKQAILVVDENQDPYLLKDSMFELIASSDTNPNLSKTSQYKPKNGHQRRPPRTNPTNNGG